MALQLSIENKYSGDTEATGYARITDIHSNGESQTVDVILLGYIDNATRQAGGVHIKRWIIQMPPAAFAQLDDILRGNDTSTNVYTKIYTYLKTLDEFSAAADV